MDKTLPDGSTLDHVDEPTGGWSSSDADRVNDMVERLASEYDRRHLVVWGHPRTWGKIAIGLTYNTERGKHKVDERVANTNDPRRVVVTYKSKLTEESSNIR